MHDPSTVAFDIKNPFVRKKSGYRPTLITVWHRDPETDGSDDSCGWSYPNFTDADRELINAIAKQQYNQLFAYREAIKDGKDYAHILKDVDDYGAVYWTWRAIKAYGKKGWQYGTTSLSQGELEQIYLLANNPVDNIYHTYIAIKDERSYKDLVRIVLRVYKRFKRKWYQHPRWHVHHWRIQFNFIRDIKRRYWDKCCICGKRGFKNSSAHGNWEGTKIWHGECDTARKAPVQNGTPQ